MDAFLDPDFWAIVLIPTLIGPLAIIGLSFALNRRANRLRREGR